jgi:DNA-binding XRE family transcriptional regulator
LYFYMPCLYKYNLNWYEFHLKRVTLFMERINRVKEILVIQGKTQLWLAEKIGKTPNTIASICNNKTQPHLKDLKLIAKVLDVDIRELLVPTKP